MKRSATAAEIREALQERRDGVDELVWRRPDDNIAGTARDLLEQLELSVQRLMRHQEVAIAAMAAADHPLWADYEAWLDAVDDHLRSFS